MKKIVIIPNAKKDTDLIITKKLINALKSFFLEPIVHISFSCDLTDIEFYDQFPKDAELIIVVGGDGSIIDASRYAVDFDIPIIGLNLGTVGYLTEVDPYNLDVFGNLAQEKYRVEEKLLLSAEVVNENEIIKSDRYAVNDVVISHSDFLGICSFLVENRRGDGVHYRADGIIVSTPEGSTAYSLSAGGPIISHDVDSLLVTPVCPHSFFNRSIIFKPDEHITITNTGVEDLKISIDGRFFCNLKPRGKCNVVAATKKIKMLTFSTDNMFSTLFKKMRISEDIK